jgi:hypothetical protein
MHKFELTRRSGVKEGQHVYNACHKKGKEDGENLYDGAGKGRI